MNQQINDSLAFSQKINLFSLGWCSALAFALFSTGNPIGGLFCVIGSIANLVCLIKF